MTKEGSSYLLLKGLPKIIQIQRTVLYVCNICRIYRLPQGFRTNLE